jgi:hypothetical protein
VRLRALIVALAVCGCRVNFDELGGGGGGTEPDGGNASDGDGVDATAIPITNVAVSPIAVSTNSNLVTATLPAPSTPGTMLVAVLAADASYFTGPIGWMYGCESTIGGRVSGLRIYPNNPGGITTAEFFAAGATTFYAQISEWTGVSSVNRFGSTQGTGTSLTLTTQNPSPIAGTLGIAAFHFNLSSPNTVTFSPSAGWSLLAESGGATRRQHVASGFMFDAPIGNATITMSASSTGDWTGCMETFQP